MLKMYLFAPIIICGAFGLAGCHSTSGSLDMSPPHVVPVEDASEGRFVADKTLVTSEEKSALSHSPTSGCDEKGSTGKIDSRLSQGYMLSIVSRESGGDYSDAATTLETVKISNWNETSFLKQFTYNYDNGGTYLTTDKCELSKDKNYQSIGCNTVGPSVTTPAKKRRFVITRNTPHCYFSYDAAAPDPQSTVQVGHYNLINGKTLPAYRTKMVSQGRLLCDKKDSGAATQIQVDVSTYEVPSEMGQACAAYTVYRYWKTLDGNKNHIDSFSDELSDYQEGQ